MSSDGEIGDLPVVHAQLFSRVQTLELHSSASSPTEEAKIQTKYARSTFILNRFRCTTHHKNRFGLYTILRDDDVFFEIILWVTVSNDVIG